MSRIFPRFAPLVEAELLNQLEQDILQGRPPSTLHPHGMHPQREYPGTGGERVTPHEMHQIREAVRTRLDALPVGASINEQDTAITAGLMATLSGDRGALFQPRVWSYMCIVLMPDIVLRRFGANRLRRNRFGSGKHNALSRLYLRGWILGDLLDEAGGALLEDDYVQLIERVMSSDLRLSRALVRETLRRATGENRREFSRGLFIEAGRESAVTDLGMLSDEELNTLVAEMAHKVSSRLQ